MRQGFSDRCRPMPGRVQLCTLLLPACLTVLAGCDRFPIDLRAPQSVAQERIDYRPGEAAIYCYRTIASPDCFDEPQPGPPNRLIQGFNRRPAE